MNRRLLSSLVAVCVVGSLAATLASCNAPSCGPGTSQKQQPDGTLKCVEADGTQAETPCDVDGGNVTIVGGRCVAAIQCDPATTTLVNGICVGHGGQVGCSAPAPGKACVSGSIYDFTTNTKNTGAPLHVELYDPITLLGGGGPIDQQDLPTDGGSYVFQNFAAPGLGLIVILTGRTDADRVATATGAQMIANGNSYVVDAYAIKKTDVAGWGFDISTGGAYIARFFSDTKPMPKALVNNEKNPVPGVILTKDGAAAGAQYFNATLTAIDNTLTATGTSGTAIVASPIPNGGMFPVFSGMGGNPNPPTGWENLPGGSAAGLVFVTRFHPN